MAFCRGIFAYSTWNLFRRIFMPEKCNRKTYHYHLALNTVQNPFSRLYCYHYRPPCRYRINKKTAAYFIGTHDFTSFANEDIKAALRR